jgi:hypothetical protein
MTETTLRRLDAVSCAVLLLWLGMALGFAFLQAPTTFHVLGSRDLAGQVVGATLRRLDWVAWAAFLLPLGLSWGSRWLAEFQEKDGIGPLRLWSATVLAALLMCFASAFIVTPKLVFLRTRMNAPIETITKEHPDRKAYDKAHGISRQLLGLRMMLALGLAVGVAFLPKLKDSGSE